MALLVGTEGGRGDEAAAVAARVAAESPARGKGHRPGGIHRHLVLDPVGVAVVAVLDPDGHLVGGRPEVPVGLVIGRPAGGRLVVLVPEHVGRQRLREGEGKRHLGPGGDVLHPGGEDPVGGRGRGGRSAQVVLAQVDQLAGVGLHQYRDRIAGGRLGGQHHLGIRFIVVVAGQVGILLEIDRVQVDELVGRHALALVIQGLPGRNGLEENPIGPFRPGAVIVLVADPQAVGLLRLQDVPAEGGPLAGALDTLSEDLLV
ncbi:MAG: hypothetical protein BWY73_01434 [candidate division TA06 bacterium ADurb.Bin417]|uniref:Uncharacterized protein n=1 Tax=candidate division TA06 bacterium ADurb.Bin417 TaxID=1852828 RepID=A0A1V5M9E4_UNCT6|nr:MAG: hypothetical protein BWY73_01434 [candidate division TA06 bacterium ADurb.Bin417]